MDTHHIAHPDMNPDHFSVSARLPGEAEPDAAGYSEHLEPSEHLYPDAQPTPSVDGHPAPNGGVKDGEAKPAPNADGRLPTSAPKRGRSKLLGGVAIVALLAVGAGVYAVSPYNTVLPMPGVAAEVHSMETAVEDKLRPILAPAASLAKVLVPQTPAPVHEHYVAKPLQDQLAELNALHAATTRSPAATTPSGGQPARPLATSPGASMQGPAGIPPGYVPSEPGSAAPAQAAPKAQTVASPPVVTPPAPDLSPVTVALLQLPPTPPQAQPTEPANTPAPMPAEAVATPFVAPMANPIAPPVTASAPASSASPAAPPARPALDPVSTPQLVSDDPVDVARSFRPGPMTPPEQVQVLNVVTEMATIVKDLRKQNAQLRSDFAKATASSAGHITDFERRLALAEARRAVAAADSAGDMPSPPDAPAPLPVTPVATLPAARNASPLATRVSAAAPVAILPIARREYRVQAASPGLALLAEVARGGGEGAQLQVNVGETIPGYGVVKSIAQRGTAWVIRTENGDIQ